MSKVKITKRDSGGALVVYGDEVAELTGTEMLSLAKSMRRFVLAKCRFVRETSSSAKLKSTNAILPCIFAL